MKPRCKSQYTLRKPKGNHIGARAVEMHSTPTTTHGHDRRILIGNCTRATDRTAETLRRARIKCDFRPSPSKRHLRMQDLITAESARIKCNFQTSPSKRHLRVQDMRTEVRKQCARTTCSRSNAMFHAARSRRFTSPNRGGLKAIPRRSTSLIG